MGAKGLMVLNAIREHIEQGGVPVIVTGNAGAVEWLARQGVTGEVIPAVSSPDEIKGKIVIAGTLPYALAAHATTIVNIHVPDLHRSERAHLDADGFESAGAYLCAYRVLPIFG